MTKVFYDCEFIEDGSTIELISIGAVTEHSEEFYAINGELSLDRLLKNDWLMKNVVPSLPISMLETGKLGTILVWDDDDTYVGNAIALDEYEEVLQSKINDYKNHVWNRSVIKRDFERFLNFVAHKDDELELWAWYGAYDHVSYAQLFGRMIDLPDGFPQYTNDLRQEVERVKKYVDNRVMFKLPKQEKGLHNALADAKHLKLRYEWLVENYGDTLKIL